MQVAAQTTVTGPAVLLCASNRLMRDALTDGFESQGSVRIVATARDAAESIAEAERHRPAVVVVSDDIGRDESLRAARTIVERVRSCSVLLLVGKEDVDTLVDAVEAGARGYVTRRIRLRHLSDAIVRLASGLVSIPEPMLRALLDALVERRSASRQGDRILTLLSAREREVLLLLANGASTDLIAQTLAVTRETARKHIQNILLKMGVRSRLEAVAYVVTHGRLALLESEA